MSCGPLSAFWSEPEAGVRNCRQKTECRLMRNLVLSTILLVGIGGCATAMPVSDVRMAMSYDEAKDIIWTKEQAIYAGRGNGDLSMYLANTADGYAAWPPYSTTPTDRAKLEEGAIAMKGLDQEELKMEFVDFVLNGSSAIIYYQTHMTMTGDGRLVDYRYEVTHTWTVEDGEWRVLGGMARSTPERK